MKKLKLSFNNFPVKIFEQGFNWRFSAKFSTLKKKKNQFTRSWSQMPLFRYLSATIVSTARDRELLKLRHSKSRFLQTKV